MIWPEVQCGDGSSGRLSFCSRGFHCRRAQTASGVLCGSLGLDAASVIRSLLV